MAATENLCAVCNQPGKLCVSCQNIRYCTRICQNADWACHKLVCRSFTQFGDAVRPSTNSIRAIIFPVADPKPKFIWLDTIRDDEGYESPNIMNLLGDDEPIPEHRSIGRSALLDRNLRHTIGLKMRDRFLIDGSKTNESIIRNIKLLPSTHTWKGPLVAIGLEGLSTDPRHCEDLDTIDFKFIMEYFSTYGSEGVGLGQHSGNEKIQGVQINCQGQQEQTGDPQFQVVEVPQQHQVFFEGKKSQIAEKIGIPLLAYPMPVRQSWKESAGKCDNQSAVFLHTQLMSGGIASNPLAAFGWASSSWNMKTIGNVLVVRSDREPLSSKQIQALCHWCQYELGPWFERSQGAYGEEEIVSEDEVRNKITAEAFGLYKKEHFDLDF